MKDQLDPKLGQHSLEQSAIEDRSGDLAVDSAANRRIQPVEIQRDDAAIAAFRKPVNEPVANLAAGSGDENNGFAH